LNKRDGVRVKHERPRGILNLRPAEAQAGSGLTRYWPSADLAPFVEHYWSVRWDLSEPRVAETVPHPSVHVVLADGGEGEVVGVMRRKFTRVLQGRGRVLGTKFHPGAFRPFLAGPVSALTDRRVPLGELFGPAGHRLVSRALARDDDREAIAVVESFLRGRRPVAVEAMALAGRAAARIAGDRSLTRVDRLARELGTTVRALQRLFGEYVGVGPKWVIQRYRLLDAVERVAEGASVDWADLALELGYADQAHFIRAFRRLVGRPPADYARRLPPPPRALLTRAAGSRGSGGAAGRRGA
jgi:AraC-like DNA-binding protein